MFRCRVSVTPGQPYLETSSIARSPFELLFVVHFKFRFGLFGALNIPNSQLSEPCVQAARSFLKPNEWILTLATFQPLFDLTCK